MARSTALVTGGNSGIGLGIARRLAADGLKVVVTGRREDALTRAVTDIGEGATWIACDVSSKDSVARMAGEAVDRLGQIDVLVNNAGVMGTTRLDQPLSEIEPIWDEHFAVNVKGPLLVTHALAPHITAPGGRVIVLSSVVARTGGSVPGMLAYSASKAGATGLTLALARELAPRGITVNGVAPGMIEDTGMTGAFDEERKAKIRAVVPLGKPGLPQDIAAAVSWLAGDGGYVTGAIIPVNGGWVFG
ncbi:SDR family NAD(P)-dependent oxidoreductase [Tropicimonas isoalkanivorans]|uniref:3-oxoacyl-[acyl-carrier protein] reductase n=1 Tax=Tropicimonas isoalkanivorans TaxID=441112 RepID=A0A1I1HWK8_9RHOB|nr:SDR family oxidoreductase [Tropicimonas isoalkanivorans]SFC28231.1 3-oxoacyl-[acyl-carrier protein] reductase [Tropicimonas isoalkanivorans]